MERTKESTRPTTSSASTKVVSDEEWEKMKLMISEDCPSAETMVADQLDNVQSSLDELRSNGSLEAIAQTIQRGDRCPSARLQAWYHGMLEVEYCNRPYSVSQKLQYMYRRHASNGPEETPQSFILDTTVTAESSGNEEWKRRSGRPLESSESVVARLERKRKLSVVERQELWLHKKNIKVAKTQSVIAEERMQERAQSAPDLTKSRQSFTMVSQDRKMPMRTTTASGVNRRPSTGFSKASQDRKMPMRTTAANAKRRPSTVARKRSITSTTPGQKSLVNITNHTGSETNTRKRQKRAKGPISDPFGQRVR